jgi:hypothetical protein
VATIYVLLDNAHLYSPLRENLWPCQHLLRRLSNRFPQILCLLVILSYLVAFSPDCHPSALKLFEICKMMRHRRG